MFAVVTIAVMRTFGTTAGTAVKCTDRLLISAFITKINTIKIIGITHNITFLYYLFIIIMKIYTVATVINIRCMINTVITIRKIYTNITINRTIKLIKAMLNYFKFNSRIKTLKMIL